MNDQLQYYQAKLEFEMDPSDLFDELETATNIVVMTENRNILNMVSLIWGVQAFYYDKMESTDGTFKDIQQIIENERIVQKGDYIVKIASMPILEKGTTNMLKIAQVE